MVEFAITVPILFLFFFASFEFCRAAMIRHTVDNAVYEATRTAMIPGATADEAENIAESIMASLGVTNVSVIVTPGTIERDTAEVTVRVSVPMSGNSYLPVQYFHGDIVRELTMRREGAS
ncbi:TadE-like protein [Planctomycetes bacterium CA13]|uniref:TadE-like protein n=2 Tax=Novipirellula herctigrandis TaxID=2527986 RepID=A0A5C5Z1V4_9BACT|nr:TadE-like protein [Planctomycetes bacterium CA13]